MKESTERPFAGNDYPGPWSSVTFFGVPVKGVPKEALPGVVVALTKGERRKKIFYANLHGLNIAYGCPRFRSSLESADLVFNDSVGLLLMARMMGHNLRFRSTFPDWMEELARLCALHGLSIFLLGDEEEVLSICRERLERNFPGLRVTGAHHGFFSVSGAENEKVIRRINEAAPDILLVGMGMPRQEFWVDENMEQIGAKVCLAVGAAFRWYCGIEKRAPRWVTDHGLEWFSRLVRRPKTFFRRYVVGNPLFLVRLLWACGLGKGIPQRCSQRTLPFCPQDCTQRQ
jgi:N-acetylglucosaminyldiphosphoundecaprenol N-acetyl-beta-D-mannosaminyltransferase